MPFLAVPCIPTPEKIPGDKGPQLHDLILAQPNHIEPAPEMRFTSDGIGLLGYLASTPAKDFTTGEWWSQFLSVLA